MLRGGGTGGQAPGHDRRLSWPQPHELGDDRSRASGRGSRRSSNPLIEEEIAAAKEAQRKPSARPARKCARPAPEKHKEDAHANVEELKSKPQRPKAGATACSHGRRRRRAQSGRAAVWPCAYWIDARSPSLACEEVLRARSPGASWPSCPARTGAELGHRDYGGPLFATRAHAPPRRRNGPIVARRAN